MINVILDCGIKYRARVSHYFRKSF